MNQVTFIPYLLKSLISRGAPTSPANRPREMSSDEPSPPYEPSHPATASTSTPTEHRILFATVSTPAQCIHYRACTGAQGTRSLLVRQSGSKAGQCEHAVNT